MLEHSEAIEKRALRGGAVGQHRLDEVVALPINNTSAENLATWFGHELTQRLKSRFGESQVRRLRVAVSETDGQSGVYMSERA